MAYYDVIFALVFLRTLMAGHVPYLVQIPEDSTYFTAAVFEHAKLGNITTDPPSEIVGMNLNFYRRATETAKSKGADIIAFPEFGLFPFRQTREDMRKYLEDIPDPKTARWNPCEQSQEFATHHILRNLSCMAKKNQIVLVAGMGDIKPCTKEQTEKCPYDGWLHYNAAVAFDRDGTLLAVFRKEHLFFEIALDLPIESQNGTFETDFGTFAMYMSYEARFKKMALSGRSVDAVILNAMTIDYRPLLSSIQQWESWTIGNSASLIVANTQIAGYGASGSGLFNGKLGPLKYTYNVDGLSKLIVSKMPRKGFEDVFPENDDASITVITETGVRPYEFDVEEERENIPDVCTRNVLGKVKDIFKDFRCRHEKTANYTFRKLVEPEGSLEACHNGLCCSLKYSTESMSETFYLGVFNGTHNSLDRYFWCEEKCFVVRCDAFNGTECNTFPATSSTVFKNLEIKATFTTDFLYPSVTGTGYRLASRNEWNFHVNKTNDGFYPASLSLTNENNRPLLVAAINSRCYDRDPPYVR